MIRHINPQSRPWHKRRQASLRRQDATIACLGRHEPQHNRPLSAISQSSSTSGIFDLFGSCSSLFHAYRLALRGTNALLLAGTCIHVALSPHLGTGPSFVVNLNTEAKCFPS
ncbi:hypothetical protein M431DRAFT_409232 [Trichoderma harzianum CBS 226.95]|uniref:Uncharacterized protein n=1 Tax=Trichoderma harzianum CBS 226.95 TaxID=983964 RepID=A0A2T4AFC9_TRIHA|nr:hypothetical protein M431DRAFT_409232 [Trichoderma harzianum CBS 226.95]PTB55794.1 hypothetical protein M431DRAFT_409232 [Trichoderma harzianum CBS 226.95]